VQLKQYGYLSDKYCLMDFIRLMSVSASTSFVAVILLTSTLLFVGSIDSSSYMENLSHRWMGHTIGMILITSLILSWHDGKFYLRDNTKIVEAILLIGTTILVGQVVFLDWFHDSLGLIARGYWEFLFVTWIAVRLGVRGVTTALVIIAIQALVGAINGTGFFSNDITKTGLQNYWYYLMIISIVGMALVSYVTEMETVILELKIKDKSLYSAANGIAITERKQLEAKIHNLAFYDSLTQLPNRRLMNDRLALAIAESKRSVKHKALMVLDLDNFKSLNDEHGHSFGDMLLVEAAQRLKNSVREIDSISRFGGDEFVVLLNGLDKDKTKAIANAVVIAEKIRCNLGQPYHLQGKSTDGQTKMVEHHVTASIGVVVFGQENIEVTAEYYFKLADNQMYKAKNAGKNRVSFYGELDGNR
jgi:diguanylate cyclase (GGDEF)-like protein